MEPIKKSQLREYRKKQGLKQKDLAKHFGVSSAMICILEYQKKKINELWARRFGEYFGVFWKKFLE